jgi:Tol biopolymer transport system component
MRGRAKWIIAVIVFVASAALLAGQSQPASQFELVSTIAFTSTRTNPACGGAEIFLMSPDGTNVRRLTDSEGCAHGDALANLSPDGKKIVFDSNRLTVNTSIRNISDLFLMNSDGTDLTPLTRGSSASWSPDGKDIAFHASASYHASGGLITGTPIMPDPGAPTSDCDIFVVNVDDLIAGAAVPQNITNSPDVIDEDADWSPDGTKIVFTRSQLSTVPPPFNYPDKEIYVMNSDGTGLTRLTFNGYEDR